MSGFSIKLQKAAFNLYQAKLTEYDLAQPLSTPVNTFHLKVSFKNLLKSVAAISRASHGSILHAFEPLNVTFSGIPVADLWEACHLNCFLSVSKVLSAGSNS